MFGFSAFSEYPFSYVGNEISVEIINDIFRATVWINRTPEYSVQINTSEIATLYIAQNIDLTAQIEQLGSYNLYVNQNSQNILDIITS